MSLILSSPIESLVGEAEAGTQVGPALDCLIVGSGYGAAFSAMHLAHRDRKVFVLERGRSYGQRDFPAHFGELPRHVRYRWRTTGKSVGYEDALFDLHVGDGIDVVVGSGLGGTSLINANVAERPDPELFAHCAWPSRLRTRRWPLVREFDYVERLLGVTRGPATFKYAALGKLADAVASAGGCAGGDGAALAAVSVNFARDEQGTPVFGGEQRLENAVGVQRAPCTGCGNCVTGCQVGAKGSLDSSIIPLAVSRGAIFHTGATVLWLERHQDKWRVFFSRTAAPKGVARDVFWLEAEQVVLAAGALGSTEILLRSQAKSESLRFSGMLGRRFSANGDAIAMGYGQQARVEPLGCADVANPVPVVGPTISGVVRVSTPDPVGSVKRLTIEDGAIPYALTKLFGEIVTTGAQAQRLGNNRHSAWVTQQSLQGRAHDSLAVDQETIAHSQCLLIMGDDGAGGRLELRYPKGDMTSPAHDEAWVEPVWPGAAKGASLEAAHMLLRRLNLGPGFDGGQYVPNPAWRALPDSAGSLSDALPGGRALTVHPLGGCPMGDDRRSGVVDDAGAVFDGDPDKPDTARHAGLFVLDGSILPTAVGINPFLTIAALASRAARLLRRRNGWALPKRSRNRVSTELAERHKPAIPPPPVVLDALRITLTEKLVGGFPDAPDWLKSMATEIGKGRSQEEIPDWQDPEGIVLRLTMSLDGEAAGECDKSFTLDDWLANPGACAIPTHVAIFPNLPKEARKLFRPDSVPDSHLCGSPVLEGHGTVQLMEPDRVHGLRRFARTVRALWAYFARRESLWRMLLRELSLGSGRTISESLRGLLAFYRIAEQHADRRRFVYKFEFKREGRLLMTFKGEKQVGWDPAMPHLWDALVDMPASLRMQGENETASSHFSADIVDMATDGVPQLVHGSDLPDGVFGVARFGMFFLRALLHSSLWEFGAPTYPLLPIPRRREPFDLVVSRGLRRVAPEQCLISVPLNDTSARQIQLVLTRYPQRDNTSAKPVLLVHGLAQGHFIFTTDTLQENMAQAMWNAGLDVWLVDHRLSNLLPDPVPASGWSMDEIGRYDIPAAVAHVRRACGEQQVAVFAHCVGATAVTMGLLGGTDREPWLKSEWISAIAFNAIHPRIRFSLTNRLRANMATILREVLDPDWLDPIPGPSPSNGLRLFDRLAFSLSRFREAAAGGHPHAERNEIAEAICDRMTLLYGRMWRHNPGNLDPRTHASFADLVGPSPMSVYRHLFYFSLRARVTDPEGCNVYLDRDKLRARWRIPTLFVHGEESEVFNPASALMSAATFNAAINRPATGRKSAIHGETDAVMSANVADNAESSAPEHRVQETYTSAQIGRLRVKDFGHMDPVCAADATQLVFPHLVGLLRDGVIGDDLLPKDLELVVHGPRALIRPVCGPIVRGAQRTAKGSVVLRLWGQLNDNGTSRPNGAVFVGGDTQQTYCLDKQSVAWWIGDVEVHGSSPLPGMVADYGADPPVEAVRHGSHPPWLKRLQSEKPEALRFLVGSCRYPGTPFESDRRDQVFKGMLRHVLEDSGDARGVDQVFFIGDQIYADATAEIVDADSWRERYLKRHEDAFKAELPFGRLASQVPIHFALDDHEFSDNWSGEPSGERYDRAKYVARLYQGAWRDVHPLTSLDDSGDNNAGEFWYPLLTDEEVACPCFILDTRSERELRIPGRIDAKMMGEQQTSALERWLIKYRSDPRPKFVFAGVVIAPVEREFVTCPAAWRNQDGWAGYPTTLAQLVDLIVEKEIQNVVFVGGDLHLSAVARLELRCKSDGKSVVAWQIVSSGLYAPLPFANANPLDFDWGQDTVLPLPGQAVSVSYRAELLSVAMSQFMRVDAEPGGNGGWSLHLQVCDAGGDSLPLETFPAGRPNWLCTDSSGVFIDLLQQINRQNR